MIEQQNQYHFENCFFDNPKICGGINLYQSGEMLCRPTTVINAHHQGYYEITYVLSGSGTVITNNTQTHVMPGDCIINFPGDIHSIVSDPKDPLRYAFSAFLINDTDPIWPPIIDELHQIFAGTDERLVHMKADNSIFYDIFTEITSDDFMASELIGISLSRFLITLIRIKRKESETHYAPQIKNESMLTYQIQHYLRHHISEIRKLTDLEPIFNYNYRYITKCFKKIAGENLGDYYLKCRMNAARKMLEDGFSVTQISDTLKYSSIHVFTRSFKKYFGIAPSEYRRNFKNTPCIQQMEQNEKDVTNSDESQHL